MGKKTKLLIGMVALILTLALIVSVRTCNRPVTNPAVKRLQDVNDSLYKIIEANNFKTDSLFLKIDSLNVKGDTIIQQQEITNQYYRNETYNILNSDNAAASKQFRATLKKSDSLLKAGFYTRTYNLRSAAFQSQLQ
jgi:hypothetical protein